MRTRLVIFVAAFLQQVTFLSSAYPDIILRYEFQGQPGNQSSQSPAYLDPNATASSLLRGSGLTEASGANSMNSRGFTTDPSVDSNHFYGFSILTNAGQQLSINKISFGERRSPSGILNFEVRTSTDGFTTFFSQFTASVPDDDLTRDQSSTITDLSNIQGTVDFRIYGFNAESTAGTWRLTDHTTTGGLTLDGTFAATAVPEPNSLALLAMVCVITGLLGRLPKRASYAG